MVVCGLGNLVITCVLVTELELPGEHIGYPLLPLVQGVYKNKSKV